MAIGLLGAAGGTMGGNTVYTVPAGISHAVVHITGCMTAASTGLIKVNGLTLLKIVDNFSTSMMLSPGDTVEVEEPGATCFVSGYEVPL